MIDAGTKRLLHGLFCASIISKINNENHLEAIKLKITANDIKQQITATNQAHFELVALHNWIEYEEPHNAKNMEDALNNVYLTLEANRRVFNGVMPQITNQREKSISIEKDKLETRHAQQIIDDQAHLIQSLNKKLTDARKQIAAYHAAVCR